MMVLATPQLYFQNEFHFDQIEAEIQHTYLVLGTEKGILSKNVHFN